MLCFSSQHGLRPILPLFGVHPHDPDILSEYLSGYLHTVYKSSMYAIALNQ